MIAEGAIAAGCRFFAGYPITPATGIFKSMVDMLPGKGGLALSAPDEISAIAYCIGASMRGIKSMTATSGPGWALMIESVQYAIMTETPLVVALVQRLGPSTGGATQGGQGDVLLAEFATSGGYTIPMLCPTNARECFDLTTKAFAWAEKLRTPVIILSDKEVGMTTESVDYSLSKSVENANRPTGLAGSNGGNGSLGTYFFKERHDVPVFEPVGGGEKVTATGSAHDKRGRLQKNSPETLEVLLHLEEKILFHKDELALVKPDLQSGAETLVVSYGITARAAIEAVRKAREIGQKVSGLTIQSLFPVPEKNLEAALNGVKRIIIAEENMRGLYASVLEPLWGSRKVQKVNKVGSMITPAEIIAAIQKQE